MAENEPPRPQRSDSRATSISLMRLDPAPIDSPEIERDRPVFDPDEDIEGGEQDLESSTASTIKPGSTYAPGLSGSGRGTIYYLTRIQEFSSYAINTFATIHLLNVSLIPAVTGSADASETYLLMTREIYQTSIAEPLFVALPFFLHIGSGIALRLVRRAQNLKRYGRLTPALWARDQPERGSPPSPWPQLSYISMSGYALTLFYGAHVFMNRILPLAIDGDSSNIGLAYVAHGFARHPLVAGLAYTGLIGISAGHAVWGSAKWLGMAPSTSGWLQPRNGGKASSVVDRKTRRERRRKWLSLHGAALGVMALWAVGGLGVVARAGASEGWIGKLYDDMFLRVGL